MLRIEQWDESNNYRTLKHSRDVFHRALRAVLDGETRFHVTGAAGLFKNFSSGPAFTFNASYLTRIKENDYSQLIEGAYVIYPSEASQTVIEMIALPKHFCISINQGGETSVYADAFCHVLQENGISCEVENILYGNTGYIEIREYEKWF